ncbi:hypothetical protein FB562_0248 [Homoserinimonas aerilata]|uniref:Uncharacterized protein n=1 Tax=Homoserinimonas aerilata TaxID=1162970 RepID=A0A542YGJ3_9MICO|nr:hypothetical protein [Homoserinimonas aerilata]TQL47197.1 hypothetical protein FB562_0248 [Homoserinimonas aerilata]
MIGLAAFLGFALTVIVFSGNTHGPDAFIASIHQHPGRWPSYLSFPVTLAMLATASVYRYVRRFRVISGTATVLIGVLPWPLLLLAVVGAGR